MAAILQHRTGPDEAISSHGLADATGLKPTTVRDCIKELRRDRELPVVSCSHGYYLIDSVDELEREVDRIQSEINTRKETKQELVAAFNSRRYTEE
jgi:biotin operon repressor